jgi:hypothetical protein
MIKPLLQLLNLSFQLGYYKVQPANVFGCFKKGLVQIPKFSRGPSNSANVLFGCKAIPFYLIVKVVQEAEILITNSSKRVINLSKFNRRK